MLKYKQNRKLIQIVCDNCGQLYDKPITEYNRNIRLKRHNYCCRSCAMKGNKNNKSGNIINLISNNRKDEFTSFRYYLRNAKNRIDSSKGYEIGNVQFISTAINYMKNTMSHEDTIKLCNIIAQKYSGDGGIR